TWKPHRIHETKLPFNAIASKHEPISVKKCAVTPVIVQPIEESGAAGMPSSHVWVIRVQDRQVTRLLMTQNRLLRAAICLHRWVPVQMVWCEGGDHCHVRAYLVFIQVF